MSDSSVYSNVCCRIVWKKVLLAMGWKQFNVCAEITSLHIHLWQLLRSKTTMSSCRNCLAKLKKFITRTIYLLWESLLNFIKDKLARWIFLFLQKISHFVLQLFASKCSFPLLFRNSCHFLLTPDDSRENPGK